MAFNKTSLALNQERKRMGEEKMSSEAEVEDLSNKKKKKREEGNKIPTKSSRGKKKSQ